VEKLINLPAFSPQIRDFSGKKLIFDRLRKKYVALTPEEWVRQHFVNYLLTCKHYPAGRIGNEISLKYNGLKKRCDTVVYDHFGHPLMLVEYKASTTAISQEVFDQIARYNLTMRAPYLAVSNGIRHYCCQMNYGEGTYCLLNEIPDYPELAGKNN
jgi:hypothetical protein